MYQQAPTVNCTQVVIITGDTGSGKTTQVAQYILEEAATAGENFSQYHLGEYLLFADIA